MISVCIATYNGEKFIRQQIESITAQLGDGDEIIVSDNGSTDSTLDIIKDIGDSRIRIIKGPEVKSLTLNFENALREAEGDYIFLADQDDVWKPGKVDTCMRWMRDYGCVVTDAEMTDADLNVTDTSYFKVHGTRQGKIYNTLVKNGYMGCCMAFTRAVLEASLPFPGDIPLHDIWIGNVAAYRRGGVKFIGDRLTLFRCHGGNSSFTARKKSGNSPCRKFVIRWKVVKNLLAKSFEK